MSRHDYRVAAIASMLKLPDSVYKRFSLTILGSSRSFGSISKSPGSRSFRRKEYEFRSFLYVNCRRTGVSETLSDLWAGRRIVLLSHKSLVPRQGLESSLGLITPERSLRKARAFVVLAVVVSALICVFVSGHPLIAVWAGGAGVSWMFIAGASGFGGEHSGAGRFAHYLSEERQMEAEGRREEIYKSMCRARGVELKNPMRG